jgi:cytochrome c biogenesis protein CcmG/thiol:disulfide interchange protein DsbE
VSAAEKLDLEQKSAGMNYKDQPENAMRFLARYGNPFVANGVDANGLTAIEWGVYGVPESFLIGRDGRIAYKLIGLIPEIEKALAALAPSS